MRGSARRWRRRARRLFPTFRTTPISSAWRRAARATLAGNALVQAVLPYEPYYKMQSVAARPGGEPAAVAAGRGAGSGFVRGGRGGDGSSKSQTLGAKIIGRDHSAFGPVLRVLAPENWTPLAQLPGVQIVEPSHVKQLANDLSRVTAGISPDTLGGMTNDWLGLTGLKRAGGGERHGRGSGASGVYAFGFSRRRRERADARGWAKSIGFDGHRRPRHARRGHHRRQRRDELNPGRTLARSPKARCPTRIFAAKRRWRICFRSTTAIRTT